MDIDTIPLGVDFRVYIDGALKAADFLLVVVGARWLGPRADGTDRISEETDMVRIEVESALRNSLAVIPVLVEGATMPPAAALPDSIKRFAFIQAAQVSSGVNFNHEVDRLIRYLDATIAAREEAAALAAETARKQQHEETRTKVRKQRTVPRRSKAVAARSTPERPVQTVPGRPVFRAKALMVFCGAVILLSLSVFGGINLPKLFPVTGNATSPPATPPMPLREPSPSPSPTPSAPPATANPPTAIPRARVQPGTHVAPRMTLERGAEEAFDVNGTSVVFQPALAIRVPNAGEQTFVPAITPGGNIDRAFASMLKAISVGSRYESDSRRLVLEYPGKSVSFQPDVAGYWANGSFRALPYAAAFRYDGFLMVRLNQVLLGAGYEVGPANASGHRTIRVKQL